MHVLCKKELNKNKYNLKLAGIFLIDRASSILYHLGKKNEVMLDVL